MRTRKTYFTIGLLIVTLLLITCSYQFLSHRPDAIKPSLNSLQKQLFVVGQSGSEEPINVQASVQPQFSLKLAEEKFKNLWTAHAAERENLVNSEIVNLKGDRNLKVETEFNDKSKQMMVTPLTENKFKPGLYTLNVKIKTYTGEEEIITQDFTWGV